MSDDDDFMQDSEPEDYDFDYEDDDDDEQVGDVDVENKYFSAKQLKTDDPETAIQEFLGVPALEGGKTEMGFKGLKQAIKLEFKLQHFSNAIEHYQELLTYVKSSVISRNHSEKSINNMLDFIDKSAADDEARQSMEMFYSKTLESFQSTNNERLWLKTNIKLARLWLDQGNFAALEDKLQELHQACQKPDGYDDPNKGTYSLEIYALEILMYAAMRNNKRVKLLYQRALSVKSAVPHPQILGVIHEAGGKMHMSEENWKAAQSDFYDAFKSYDEVGSLQRIQVLNYLVLCTMLMGSKINPFDSKETKAYQNHPRIAAMTGMVNAYQRQDIKEYEEILKQNPELMEDPFVAENIAEVTRAIRTNSVLQIIAPYRRFSLLWLAKKVQISLVEAQDIISFLIMDQKLRALIDQPSMTVDIQQVTDGQRMDGIRKWTGAIDNLCSAILRANEFSRAEEGGGQVPRIQSSRRVPLPQSMDVNGSRPRTSKSSVKRPLYTGT